MANFVTVLHDGIILTIYINKDYINHIYLHQFQMKNNQRKFSYIIKIIYKLFEKELIME